MQQVNMEALQKDVLEVLQRHIHVVKSGSGSAPGGVTGNMVSCNMRSEGDVCLFEMSVEIDGIQNYNQVHTTSARGGQRARADRRR